MGMILEIEDEQIDSHLVNNYKRVDDERIALQSVDSASDGEIPI